MYTRCKASSFINPLIVASVFFASVSCKAQTNVDLTNLFSSTNQIDLQVLSSEQSTGYQSEVLASPTQSLVDNAPTRFQPALYEWKKQDGLAAIEYVAFRHFEAERFTEATYEPVLKIGYSQPVQGMDDTLFNVSVSSIKPAATSFLVNALSVTDEDVLGDKSTFLSVSIHSKF
ncbi:MAG: hypothetical protein AAGJ37_00835 [Pseudomonadota bacterium]